MVSWRRDETSSPRSSFSHASWALPVLPAAASLDATGEWLQRTFGWGLIIAAGAAVTLGLVARFAPKLLLTRWHRWLAALMFCLIAWAALGYFHTDTPLSEYETSLGGQVGRRLLAGNGVIGGLLIALYVLTAFALLIPGRALRAYWRTTVTGWRGGMHVGRYTARQGKSAARWLQGKDTLTPPTPEGAAAKAGVKPATPPVLRDLEAAYPEATTNDGAALPKRVKGLLNRIGTRERTKAEQATEAAAESADEFQPEAPAKSKRQGWKLPPMALLEETPEAEVSKEENEKRAKCIEESLSSFGVETKVAQINPGPTVTQFGLEPGWVRKFREVRERDKEGKFKLDKNGNYITRKEEVARSRVKVDAILALEKDLALALAAPTIRMEAPVPGKSVVGVEVPNAKAAVVGLRMVMDSPQFERVQGKNKLAIGLGRGTGGDAVAFDLAKMPHLLIAGATGSGKSVCMMSTLTSLLYQFTPEEMRFLLIDPKRVELVTFNRIPHLLAPVITDTDKVVPVLRWANMEMDSRYKRFQAAGARNVETFNRIMKGKEVMPFLVIAVDELADLMLTAPVDVEHSLTRLAQLGRAAGIHLVLATQRPSVDVVTGLIKANFPARISFAVSSGVDSRTILDTVGAEKLLGRGDMLFLPPDAPKPKRIQGCFIADREVDAVTRFWAEQRSMEAPARLSEKEILAVTEGPEAQKADPLMERARQVANTSGRVSTSLLQRKLGIGYPRAARLMELLEEEGLVESKGGGPPAAGGTPGPQDEDTDEDTGTR